MFSRIGAGNMDHRHMAQLIKRRTGGLSVSPHVVAHHTEASTYNQVFSRNSTISTTLYKKKKHAP